MERYGSVWDALFDDKEEALNLKIRSGLMIEIEKYIKSNGLTQQQAADHLGESQPRISDIVNGKIDKFTIDSLVNLVAKTGAEVKIIIQKDSESAYNAEPWLNFGGLQRIKKAVGELATGYNRPDDWGYDIYQDDQYAIG